MKFDELGLETRIVANLAQMGYHEPRPIQAACIPEVLDGHDVIGLAQTGMGKTAAYAASMIQQILRMTGDTPAPRGLILCPTRELAQQVAEEATRIAQGVRVRVGCVYGKVAVSPQRDMLANGIDLLVGTTGRVRELRESEILDLSRVRIVTIDEADRMMDMGFLPQVRGILSGVPAERQTLLFTATLPPAVESLARQFQHDPVRKEIGRHTTTVDFLDQQLMAIDDRNKVPLLLHLLNTELREGVLIFCRTKRRVGWVGTALSRQTLEVGMIHGDRSQAQRQRALDGFLAGKTKVIVATEVASRGLHIPVVRTVINYDVPLTPEEYVHRVGRAGHGAKSGKAITFLTPDERARWEFIQDRLDMKLRSSLPKTFDAPFEPRDPKPRSTRPPKDAKRVERDELLEERPGRPPRKSRKGPRRGRKNRPLGKDDQPGSGVRRPGS